MNTIAIATKVYNMSKSVLSYYPDTSLYYQGEYELLFFARLTVGTRQQFLTVFRTK